MAGLALTVIQRVSGYLGLNIFYFVQFYIASLPRDKVTQLGKRALPYANPSCKENTKDRTKLDAWAHRIEDKDLDETDRGVNN